MSSGGHDLDSDTTPPNPRLLPRSPEAEALGVDMTVGRLRPTDFEDRAAGVVVNRSSANALGGAPMVAMKYSGHAQLDDPGIAPGGIVRVERRERRSPHLRHASRNLAHDPITAGAPVAGQRPLRVG